MEFWEFLLQKEGDRSWLPLESPKVEILEGRYRVVARSNRVNTPVEIRITHDSMAEMPPVRRTQKRTGKTNRDGLVVIIPFTRLSPGMWELRCTSELMADMLGEGWQYAVQFQIDPETPEDWDPDWQDDTRGAEAVKADQIAANPIAFDSTASAQTLADFPASDQTVPEPEPTPAAGAIAAEVDSLVQAFTSPVAESEVQTDVTSAQIPAQETAPSPDNLQPSPDNLQPIEAENLESVPSEAAVSDTELSQVSEAELVEPTELTEETIPSASPINPPTSQSANLLPLTPLSVDAAGDAAVTKVSAIGTGKKIPPMRLRLAQDTYVVERGQPLSVIGQVEHLAGLLTDEIPVGELHIRLYDPRTSRVLADQRQPLTPRRLPFPFSCQLTLPDHYQTYLLLGEVALYGISTANGAPELVTQSFTVTTDLHELLESIANDFPEPDLVPPVAPEPKQSENIAFLNLATTAQVTLEFRTSTSPILPPQLHPTNPERSSKAPQLPALPRTSASSGLEAEADIAQDAPPTTELDLGETIPAIETDFSADAIPDVQIIEAVRDEQLGGIDPVARSATQTGSSEASSTAPIIQSFDDEEPIPDWYEDDTYLPQWQRQSQPEMSQGTVSVNDPKDAAFRALNLQERFWDRMQALMHDRELLIQLQSETEDKTPLEVAHSAEENPSTPQVPGRSKQASVGLDAALAAQEVVAEDALLPTRSSHPSDSATDVFQPDFALVVPIEQPIPPPQVELRPRELVAGQSFNFTVKLPNIPARLYAKVWLRDRQTRTLLSGPHWLTEFVPDGFGNQIIRTELSVPKGCLEVQIEAITVEMPTQRESDKVSVTREVIPPNLSAFSLDDFEI